MYAAKIPLVMMGGRAEGQACLDPWARTPLGASRILNTCLHNCLTHFYTYLHTFLNSCLYKCSHSCLKYYSKCSLQYFYSLIYNLQPLDFVKIYNITLKLAKSTSKIKLFITNLQANHNQMLAKSTIYKKGKPPIVIHKISEHKDNFENPPFVHPNIE